MTTTAWSRCATGATKGRCGGGRPGAPASSCPPRRTSGGAFPCRSLTAPRFSAIPASVSGLSFGFSRPDWVTGLSLRVRLLANYGYLVLLLPTRRNALEGFDKPGGALNSPMMSLHNLVHSFLNGTSVLPHAAASDPIFVVCFFPPECVVVSVAQRQLSYQGCAKQK